MFTPQEVNSKKFAKAVFGGYDMGEVDEFLDELMQYYEQLYKENAVLKSKLKVLADTVEEYKSVDDSMRKTLLAAQTIANKLITEAENESREMRDKARAETQAAIGSLQEEVKLEQQRLAKAKRITSEYVEDAIERSRRFIASLGTVEMTNEAADEAEPAEEPEIPAPADEFVFSVSQAIGQAIRNEEENSES
jgi:cell division initiation protein